MSVPICFCPVNKTSAKVMERYCSFLSQMGFEAYCVSFPEYKLSNVTSSKTLLIKRPRLFSKISSLIDRAIDNSIFPQGLVLVLDKLREILALFWLSKKSQEIQSFIALEDISAVLLYGDRHWNLEPAVLHAAKAKNVRRLILPIAFPSGQNRIEATHGDGLRPLRRFAYTHSALSDSLRPHQARSYRGKQMFLFYENWKIRVLNFLDVLSDNPWVLGCGSSDVIFLENHDDLVRLEKDGLPSRKAMVIGHVDHDVLFNNLILREKTKEHYRCQNILSEDKKTVVVALSALMEHRLLTTDQHFQVIAAILNLNSLKQYNLLVILHPKMNFEFYSQYLQDFNCSLIVDPLAEVLPIADAFIVGAGSTTSRWGYLCSIPTIVTSWYDHWTDRAERAPEAVYVESKNDLEFALVSALTAEPQYGVQKPLIDGRACARLATAIRDNL